MLSDGCSGAILCGQVLWGHMTSMIKVQLPYIVMDVEVWYSLWTGGLRSHDKHDQGAVTIHCGGCSGVILSVDRYYEVTWQAWQGLVTILCDGCSGVLLCSGRCYEVMWQAWSRFSYHTLCWMFRCTTLFGQVLWGHITSLIEMQLPYVVMDVQVYYSVQAGVMISHDGCSGVILSVGRCWEVTWRVWSRCSSSRTGVNWSVSQRIRCCAFGMCSYRCAFSAWLACSRRDLKVSAVHS